MIARVAKIQFNHMKSSLATCCLVPRTSKYYYFAHHLAHCPSMTRPRMMAQSRQIIDPSSVPSSSWIF